MTLDRLTPEEMTEIARGVVTRKYYVAWDPMALEYSFGGFLMLAIGGLQAQGDDPSFLDDVGLVYEEIDKAGYHSVNGYPSFMSAKFIHKDDRWIFQRECMRLSVAIGETSQEDLDRFDADLAEFERRKTEEESDGAGSSAG